MSENNELKKNESQQNNLTEKVGGILHKERVTKRISLETISKDLKLNVNYIKAIESSTFSDLPADPYIRVYLRSIAQYLMLDSEDLLRKFFEERGIPDTNLDKERSDKISVDIDRAKVSKATSTERGFDHKIWVIALIILIGVLSLVYMSNVNTWFRSVSNTIVATEKKNTTIQPNFKALDDSLESDLDNLDDSIIDTGSFYGNDLSVSSNLVKNTNKTLFADSLELVITAKTDSVWVQVFNDGISWRNFIKPDENKTFVAKDSLNVHVGRNSLTEYYLNGERIFVTGSGIKVFKIDSSGIELWKMSKWKKTFKGRL